MKNYNQFIIIFISVRFDFDFIHFVNNYLFNRKMAINQPFILTLTDEIKISEVIRCFHTLYNGKHQNTFDNIISRVQKFIKKCPSCKKEIKKRKKNKKNKEKPLAQKDLRYKLKSQVGYCTMKSFNEELKRINRGY